MPTDFNIEYNKLLPHMQQANPHIKTVKKALELAMTTTDYDYDLPSEQEAKKEDWERVFNLLIKINTDYLARKEKYSSDINIIADTKFLLAIMEKDNMPQAITYHQEAAALGGIHSRVWLGNLECNKSQEYEQKYKSSGVIEYLETANDHLNNGVEHLTIAADAGNSSAMHSLGVFLILQETCTEEYGKKAEKYLKTAAKLENPADAQCALGYMYEKARGVDQDYKEAYRLYSLAAKKECPRAWFLLGKLYFNGYGMAKKNRLQAYSFLHKAQETGLTVENHLNKIRSHYQQLSSTSLADTHQGRKDLVESWRYYMLVATEEVEQHDPVQHASMAPPNKRKLIESYKVKFRALIQANKLFQKLSNPGNIESTHPELKTALINLSDKEIHDADALLHAVISVIFSASVSRQAEMARHLAETLILAYTERYLSSQDAAHLDRAISLRETFIHPKKIPEHSNEDKFITTFKLGQLYHTRYNSSEEKGDFTQARDFYQQAINIDIKYSKHKYYVNYLMGLLWHAEHGTAGVYVTIGFLEEANKHGSYNSNAAFTLANIYMELYESKPTRHNYKIALKWLEKDNDQKNTVAQIKSTEEAQADSQKSQKRIDAFNKLHTEKEEHRTPLLHATTSQSATSNSATNQPSTVTADYESTFIATLEDAATALIESTVYRKIKHKLNLKSKEDPHSKTIIEKLNRYEKSPMTANTLMLLDDISDHSPSIRSELIKRFNMVITSTTESKLIESYSDIDDPRAKAIFCDALLETKMLEPLKQHINSTLASRLSDQRPFRQHDNPSLFQSPILKSVRTLWRKALSEHVQPILHNEAVLEWQEKLGCRELFSDILSVLFMRAFKNRYNIQTPKSTLTEITGFIKSMITHIAEEEATPTQALVLA